MPALSLAGTPPLADPSLSQSSSRATSRDPLNYYMRPPAPRGQRQPNDVFSNHALYDGMSPSLFIPQYSHPAYFERVYPLPNYQNPTQGHNTPLGPPPTAFSYFSIPPQAPASSWPTHVSTVQHNSYPPQSLPPSQPIHKVWILDCKSCGTFLTNRGMKAVLLLRPNVSLFSTDALPVNCSAYTTNPDALRPPPCRPSTSSPPRTCECLTQTLCCHTCGTAVGYMIVIPCPRCTSSITATNRATNGHRFVFHSNEIVASERYHIPDEPGVIPVESVAPPVAPPPLTSAYLTQSFVDGPTSYRRISHSFASPTSPSPAFGTSPSESIPTPLSEYGDLGSTSLPSSPEVYFFERTTSPRHSPRPLPRSPSPRTSASQPTQSSSQPGTGESTLVSRGMPVEFRDPPLRKLKAGDVLYWHHLAKNGEIPGVQEDPRSRMPKPKGEPKFSDR